MSKASEKKAPKEESAPSPAPIKHTHVVIYSGASGQRQN